MSLITRDFEFNRLVSQTHVELVIIFDWEENVDLTIVKDHYMDYNTHTGTVRELAKIT